MIPAGVERDRVIAELRGIECVYLVRNDINYYVGCTFLDGKAECKNCRHETFCYKPYSTDIATAMELWEEMKGAGNPPYLICSGAGYVECYLHINGEQLVHTAGTEADAISGAYLRWRKGE